MQLYDWQQPNADAIAAALATDNVAADGSDTGVGKMYITCAVAKAAGRPLAVVCPKSIVLEWRKVAAMWSVPCEAINYEQVRAGKTVFGSWAVKGRVFQWAVPNNVIVCFDEIHACGGLKTQNSKLLIAAKRQGLTILGTSATMLANPLKGYAIGYALGLHSLTDFWQWAVRNGARKGYFGMEWTLTPGRAEQVMNDIRVKLGAKFVRIQKKDVPNFPQNQIIPQFVDTVDLPELTGVYTVDARQAVEVAKVPAMVSMAEDLLEAGHSVVLFVNFVATLEALREHFPKAGAIRGGQSAGERGESVNSFQQNANPVLLVMSQAGGTGLSLHDLHGRPRAAIISPGWSAVEFLQVLGRIHRAGALSPAVNYVLFASYVSVERRIRSQLELKLNNLSALNDYDLGLTDPQQPEHPDSPAASGSSGGAVENAVTLYADQHCADGSTEHHDVSVVSGPHHNPMTTPQQVSTPNKTGAHGERKHARCSPSKLKNLEICPSYEGDNSGPAHPVTLRGTAMHEALETGKLDGLDPEGGEVEKNLVAMVTEYIEEEKTVYDIVEYIDEAHLKTHDRDVQGFIDRIMLGPIRKDGTRVAYIRDYKFGFNLVDSPSINPQAIAYSVGVFLKIANVAEVNFSFMIPRLDAILEHTFFRSELPAMKLRLSVIADRVRQLAGKEWNLNNDNCLYCGRKATCPATMGKALVIANGYNEDDKLGLPTEFHSSLLTDPIQMAKALNVAAVMEKWVDSVRVHALALRLEVGIEIPGYQLTERQGKRSVVSAQAVYDIAQTFGVTTGEFMAAADVSLPQLEKAVGAHTEKGKAKRVQEFNDALTDAGAINRGQSYHLLQKERKKAAA